MKRTILLLGGVVLAGCSGSAPESVGGVQQFLQMYNEVDQRLYAAAADAHWKASTDVSDLHTGQRIGADMALAAFRGSRYVIESSRRHLGLKEELTQLEFRQLDKILLNAAESPGTIPDIVKSRVEEEARLEATLDGFTFCLETRGADCARPITANQIDETLLTSRDLNERRRVWEVSKQTGRVLKPGLARVRDLRNRVASELGYSSYFHLQVADYGMQVSDMLELMDRTVRDVQPLYQQLHAWTRRKLAERYKQPVPERLPAHWLANRWGQEWPGLVEAVNLDPLFRDRSPEWVVQQAERFYVSIGMPPLPKSFWERSDLYQLPQGSKRKKNTHASAWHMDRAADVRSLMSVIPNYRWFETSHHELGHVYYFMAYSNPRVPHVLREGLNRAFHEAVGELIGMAARQPAYLRQIGVMPADRKVDLVQQLLSEALDSSVVFLPWSAGTMTRFEHDLYEQRLPEKQFNQRWWELVRRYQAIDPPASRGEELCDGCTKTHVIDDAAQYYDYAIATLLKYQLHDHIARKILKQDPRECNYYGNKEVGRWLMGILSQGATAEWHHVLKEATGEDLSPRALLEYFQPLREFLEKENAPH